MLVASLPPMPAGGAEIQALKLAETLTKKGVKVSFITPGNSKNKGLGILGKMPVYRLHSWLNGIFESLSAAKKNKQSPNTRIEYDDKKEITNQITRKAGWPTVIYYNIFFFHSLFFLWRRRSTFDIIHAHTMEWSAIVATRLGKALHKKVIIKDSTMNGFQSLSRFPSGHHLQKLITGHAHFIAMTKMINENLLQQGIPTGQITRIPNGIFLKENRGTHVTGNKPAKILFVGNLYQQPAKGIDVLLHAFQIVHKLFPEVVLQIVGDGVNEAYYTFVRELSIDKVVEFCGKQSDLESFYNGADIFVLPSRREGMSNALMEAMLYGIPCIATDISGSQDLITNGQNGILVQPANVDALAEAMNFMLSHPEIALKLGEKARE
ncbi:MAG TPA: glycosyltransferase family 4 protein, partial [Puia sp.]|nr:glycosyltransferase family 4 protein [Puia sp.]